MILQRMRRGKVIFMECDIQEPMRRLAPGFAQTISNAVELAEIAANIKAPLIST